MSGGRDRRGADALGMYSIQRTITRPNLDGTSDVIAQLKVPITSLIAAAVCLPLTFFIWPPEVPAGAGTLAQWLGYGLLAGECLTFGAGIAFLAFTFPRVGSIAISRRLAFASYAGIAFLLINWWPHAHVRALAANLETARPLIRQIIYAFHDAIMVIGAVLVFRHLRRRGQSRPASSPRCQSAGLATK